MTQQLSLDDYSAERRKLDGITLAGTGDRAWNESCDRAIAHLAALGRSFTADDVRDLAGEPDHPNALGARLSLAAKAGVIVCIDYRTSARASRHLGLLRVWRGRQTRGYPIFRLRTCSFDSPVERKKEPRNLEPLRIFAGQRADDRRENERT